MKAAATLPVGLGQVAPPCGLSSVTRNDVLLGLLAVGLTRRLPNRDAILGKCSTNLRHHMKCSVLK